MSNCHLILDCSMHSHVQRGNEEKTGFSQDVSRAYRALSIMVRSHGFGTRGIPSLSYSEAYDRVLVAEAYNNTANKILIAGAAGLLLAPAAEAGYMYTMANPISSYNFATATLDGGWTASAWGISYWSGRAGQMIELITKGLTK